jgi:hypothetical protein
MDGRKEDRKDVRKESFLLFLDGWGYNAWMDIQRMDGHTTDGRVYNEWIERMDEDKTDEWGYNG